MEFKLSNLVKWSAFVIPIVPAASMADQVFKDVTVGTSFSEIFWLTLILSFVGGIGYEMVGIGAGHLSVRYFVEKNWTFFSLAAIALVVYVSIGFFKFGTSTSGLFLIIAPFVYLLAGMIETSEAAETKQKELDARAAEIEQQTHELMMAERAADAEFKRQEKAKANEFKRQQAATNQVAKQVSSSVAGGLQFLVAQIKNEAVYKRLLPEVDGTKRVIVETLHATPDATRQELAATAKVSPQAISKNVSGLNKMIGQFSAN